ncbi:MAG: hypothetical protein FJ319_08575 [SAR202 cluster bacterium]|nr:hypothetical protein [SAR202 cluster bacterium]
MNRLRDDGIIKDWAIFGSVAFLYHGELVITRDVDVVVECSVSEYEGTLLPILRQYGREDPPGVFDLRTKKLQVIPTADKKLYPELVERAVTATVDDVPVRVAVPEHLIIEALDRWDSRKLDPMRVVSLYPKANRKYLYQLIKKYEKEDRRLIKNIKSLGPFINGPLFG